MKRINVGALMAMTSVLGLPSEPILRAYDRPYGTREAVKTISRAERERRKAKKKAAKASKRRNR